MKKNFKKLLSMFIVAVMFVTMFSVSVSAAQCTITLAGGSRGSGANKVEGVFNEMLSAIEGDTYTDENGVVYTLNKTKNTITFKTDASGKFTFPEYFFDMAGYEQYAWVTKGTTNAGAKYTGAPGSVKKNTTYYAGYQQKKYDISFLPGADGEGEAVTITGKAYNSKITLEDAIFTRPGYVQIGWATTENAAAAEYALSESYTVVGEISFYPVWQKAILSVTYDVNRLVFGSLCVGYTTPDALTVTITNKGNTAIALQLPASESFSIVATGSTTIAANGGTLAVTVQPKADLAVGKYSETLAFDFGNEEINFAIYAKFVVNDHLFVNYVSDGNATYTADGTETAKCFNCDKTDTRTAVGSMKIYSADNNTADGLLDEYLYYKTVKFVAYGSGMDAAEGELQSRFRPTEWSVEGTDFGGKFTAKDVYNAEDYTVKYDHGDGNFGTYTLTIKYVEETKNADGEWEANGTEDVKTFKYSIGPSEKDNQEVVRPNMITSIIFGLLGYLVELIAGGSLF